MQPLGGSLRLQDIYKGPVQAGADLVALSRASDIADRNLDPSARGTHTHGGNRRERTHLMMRGDGCVSIPALRGSVRFSIADADLLNPLAIVLGSSPAGIST